MSSSRVKTFKRELNYSAVFTAPNRVVFTTQTPHYLITGNLVDIIEFVGTAQLPNMVVNVIDANTFTLSGEFIVENGTLYIIANGNTLVVAGSVDITDAFWMSGKVNVKYFSTGMTGLTQTYTIPRSNGASSVVQFTATGTGGVTLIANVSIDGIGWIPIATVTLPATNLASDFLAIAPNWAYVNFTLSSIGAVTTVSISMAS